MRIVLDTNVLVSGLITTSGKPAQVVDLVIERKAVILLNAGIFLEYQDVLGRPHLRIPRSKALETMAAFWQQGEHLPEAPLDLILPDPDDRPFLEAAISGVADALVTGNLKDYPMGSRHGIQVVDPAAFLRMLEREA